MIDYWIQHPWTAMMLLVILCLAVFRLVRLAYRWVAHVYLISRMNDEIHDMADQLDEHNAALRDTIHTISTEHPEWMQDDDRH